MTLHDRTVPCNVEAERATLGSVLLNRDAIVALDGWLTPDLFYLEKHAWIYAAMLACYHRRVPPDTSTVADELRRHERLDPVGGLLYLIELANAVPSSVHVEYYGRTVERTGMLRRLISAGGAITALGFDEREELETTLERAERELLALTNRQGPQDYQPMHQIVDAQWQTLSRRLEGELPMGVATGYVDFDEVTGGLQPSDLLTLAARPGVGKTSLMLSWARSVAQTGGKVGVVSLEMGRDQLTQRLLAMQTGIDLQTIRCGRVDRYDIQRLTSALGDISQLSLFIDDTAGQRISDVRAKARRLHATVGLDVLFVDYLQLLAGSARPEHRVAEVSAISAGLKSLARELNIPVVALSQLSRAVEGRADHVPQLSDLRESGAIEQDSDLVIFIYREELYDKDTDKKGVAELHIAKHRNGPTAVIPLRFDGNTTQFHNLERYRSPEGY